MRGLALAGIVVLRVLIGATVAMFRRRSRTAAVLLPYRAWVTFATALNASIWWLDR